MLCFFVGPNRSIIRAPFNRPDTTMKPTTATERPSPAAAWLLLQQQRWFRHLARWAAALLAPPRRALVPIPARITPPPADRRRRTLR